MPYVTPPIHIRDMTRSSVWIQSNAIRVNTERCHTFDTGRLSVCCSVLQCVAVCCSVTHLIRVVFARSLRDTRTPHKFRYTHTLSLPLSHTLSMKTLRWSATCSLLFHTLSRTHTLACTRTRAHTNAHTHAHVHNFTANIKTTHHPLFSLKLAHA